MAKNTHNRTPLTLILVRCPTAEEMDALRRDDDWQNTEAESFSVKKIKQYYAHCSPLSTQDVKDGGHANTSCGCPMMGTTRRCVMTSFVLSSSCPTLRAIFTKGIWRRLLEANSLRSKNPTTASNLLSFDLAEGTGLPLRHRGRQ